MSAPGAKRARDDSDNDVSGKDAKYPCIMEIATEMNTKIRAEINRREADILVDAKRREDGYKTREDNLSMSVAQVFNLNADLVAKQTAFAAEKTALVVKQTALAANQTALAANEAVFAAEKAAFAVEKASFAAENAAFAADKAVFVAEKARGAVCLVGRNVSLFHISHAVDAEGVREQTNFSVPYQAEFGIGRNPTFQSTGIVINDKYRNVHTDHCIIKNDEFGLRVTVVGFNGIFMDNAMRLDDKICKNETKNLVDGSVIHIRCGFSDMMHTDEYLSYTVRIP